MRAGRRFCALSPLRTRFALISTGLIPAHLATPHLKRAVTTGRAMSTRYLLYAIDLRQKSRCAIRNSIRLESPARRP